MILTAPGKDKSHIKSVIPKYKLYNILIYIYLNFNINIKHGFYDRGRQLRYLNETTNNCKKQLNDSTEKKA